MKTIKPISLIALFVFIFVGCTPAQPVDVAEVTEESAKQTALDFVKGMDEYLNKKGQNLEVTEVLGMACDGCFLVYLEFDVPVSESDEFEIGKVKLILEDMKVIDSEYVEGDIVGSITN